ncbi:MAG: glycosyltransferase [Candidatus Methanoplasma sp.]|nr:glycosyltransferase [Candidatus Methanoplasma sp.]
MRIAMITDSYLPTRDGVVTAVITLRKALEDLGHTVFVIAPDPGEADREEGVIYFPAKKFKKYPEYFLPIFPSNKIERIKALDVDVIHIYGVTFMALKALISARTLKIPTVMTYVTNVVDTMEYYSPLPLPMELQSRLAWIYMRNYLKRPHCIIALTESTIAEFEENRVRTKRTEVIPIGIDVHRFRRGLDGSEIRKRYSLNDKRVIIHVGRVSYEKNIDTVIRSVKYLPDDVRLMVVGKGPALDEMKEIAETEGLNDRVVFTGFVPDDELALHYAVSDVVVSASRFETQGLTIAEAMACGLPAACSDGRAFLDVVTEGYNGYFFGDTPEGCAEAIVNCLESKGTLSDNARKTAETYSMETVGKKLTEVYEQVVDKFGK